MRKTKLFLTSTIAVSVAGILAACGPLPTDSASTTSGNATEAQETVAAEGASEDNADVPLEYRNALKAAQNYLEYDGFSAAGLRNQLTSEYGEKFPQEAAQYALDNVKVDWNQEALEAAQGYLDTMGFSKAGLYDQLVSEAGEQFSPEQAQFAVDNVTADYTAEAVEAAKAYQETMPMSREGLVSQLTSEYGDKFTAEQAQAAADKLGL